MAEKDTKSRILEAATRVFAEKSFDGARIDEIANEAGVPKSLIYYHFRSKDEILEVLAKRLIDEYAGLLRGESSDTHREKAERLEGRMKNVFIEFEKRNADLIRIMFIESLKKTKEQPILFRVVEAMIEAEKKQAGDDFDEQESLAAEFFTRLIPTYAYICFGDAWIQYFHTTRSNFDQLFLKLIVGTHGSYHRSHDNNLD